MVWLRPAALRAGNTGNMRSGAGGRQDIYLFLLPTLNPKSYGGAARQDRDTDRDGKTCTMIGRECIIMGNSEIGAAGGVDLSRSD